MMARAIVRSKMEANGMNRRKVIIIGAAGRDFHNFNTRFRSDASVEIVAFTAAQIPDIDGRKYPPELAGRLYPEGIPIYVEADLPRLIRELSIDECVFSYSDVPYSHVMSISALVNAAGASFTLLGPKDTQIKSTKPIIAVCAVRTGSGKSQTSRKIVQMLMAKGLKVVAIRHPMPYGDLVRQKVQRFATLGDLAYHKCTIEEMENTNRISSGQCDLFRSGLRSHTQGSGKRSRCDPLDGGNNDFPFYVPDLLVTVADPLRAGNEVSFYPGEASLRMADAIIINKIDSAGPDAVQTVRGNIAKVNPKAIVIDAASPISVDKPELIKGKCVLCIEDGPTLTHGMMKIGAGVVAARKFQAAEIIDPRPYVVASSPKPSGSIPISAPYCPRWAMAPNRFPTWK